MWSFRDEEFDNTFFAVLALLGTIINAVLFICVLRNPLGCFRNSSSYLVANHALSNLLTCSTMAFYCVAMLHDASRANASVKDKITGALLVLTFTRFLALFLVSLDRFLAVRYPLRYRLLVKSSITFAMISVKWSSCVFLILLNVFAAEAFETATLVLWGTGAAFVFVKVCLHCLAFSAMKKRSEEIQYDLEESSQSRPSPARRTQRRFLLTIAVITAVVLITVLPFLAYYSFHQVSWTCMNIKVCVVSALYWLGFIVGPGIYFVRMRNYYQTFKVIFCKACCM